MQVQHKPVPHYTVLLENINVENNEKACVLSIAGSDSSAGAGIQADLKTIIANGAYAATAITLITAQNTQGVDNIFALPVDMITAQIDAIFTDLKINAVKLGMLYSRKIMLAVKQRLRYWQAKNIVLDPVMMAQGGAPLIDATAIKTLPTLFPLAALITPNIPEANALLGISITSIDAMQYAARELGNLYKSNILLKGGHLQTHEANDVFFDYSTNTDTVLQHPRITTQNTHGTGCTLSAAIAAYLAQGNKLATAIYKAKYYLSAAITAATTQRLGKGHGPVEHFFMHKDSVDI
jgi:hydroxymethylpyrimidine/phosphomethylpyrimidine kinase